MPPPVIHTDVFCDRFPYVQIGDGPVPLAVFPGLNDALQPVTTAPRFWARLCRPFMRGRSIYVISRRRDLPQGYSTSDMAADYAKVIDTCLGRTDVLGISMGGFIAQRLAAEYARCVRRMVFIAVGPRPDPAKLKTYERWHKLARTGRWRETYADMIAQSYAGRLGATAVDWLESSPKSLQRLDIDPADFIVSIDACLSHDARPLAAGIANPALVLGGTEDRLTSSACCAELAACLPDAKHQIIEGAGHALLEHGMDECGQAIRDFLN